MLMMRAKVQGHRWVDHPAAAVMEARVPGQWVDRPAAMVMEAREQGRCWIDHPAAAVMEARVQGRHWVYRPSVAIYMMLWSDMFLAYTEMHSNLTRQKKLNDFLLAVTKSIFQDISMDTVIMKIMSFARKLVTADRASIFMLDHDTSELYARIFDVGSGASTAGPLVPAQHTEIRFESFSAPGCREFLVSPPACVCVGWNFAKYLVSAERASPFLVEERSHQLLVRIFDTGSNNDTTVTHEIRFPMDKGVAGHVATTGEILNIPDAYADNRFNRDVDLQTGYRTKTILCMPIYIRGNVIGVVQMVNKRTGTFTRTDEESFETFAVYCGLALHHAKLYDKIRRSEQKYRVALEVLSYHSQATEDELNHLRALPVPEHIPSITDYKFSPWSVESEQKPLYVLFMFRDLFSQMRYDLEDLMRFTLTVRRNYRNVPYHNWVHAFSVAHSMYTFLKTCRHELTHLQCLALFVACLCHDLDHRGKTNSFMVKSASPLAAVYSTSTMEHHHFNQTVTILQHEGHNIFKHLTSEEYKQVLSDIRHSILATDLVLFFTNHARLKDILARTGFSWDLQEHRQLVMGVSMTACDLCAMFKPWHTQLDLVYVIMEEFWQQGDEEKAEGMTPMPMMDRDKQNELPQLEVGFILGICLPCYELLTEIIPEAEPMLTGVTENLKRWQQLAEEHKALCGGHSAQLAITNSAEKDHDNDGHKENHPDSSHDDDNESRRDKKDHHHHHHHNEDGHASSKAGRVQGRESEEPLQTKADVQTEKAGEDNHQAAVSVVEDCGDDNNRQQQQHSDRNKLMPRRMRGQSGEEEEEETRDAGVQEVSFSS
ncbi:hypothetical protein ACOMHN_006474 [Nucella lapillus]